MPKLNQELVKMALYSARKRAEKLGFVPSDVAAAAAGGVAPPGVGGPPPGGPPPGDPSMGMVPPGGPPPGVDPSMSGGMGLPMPPMPPPMPPMDPSMMSGGGDIRSIIRDELQSAGLVPGKAGNGPGAGKAPKPDIQTIATDVFQLKKMILHDLRLRGVELPPDILDGPNRDPVTGAPAASPTGGSDVPPGGSLAATQSAIKPIEPMPGAFPSPVGGMGGGIGAGEKGASFSHNVGQPIKRGAAFNSRAALLARAWRMVKQTA